MFRVVVLASGRGSNLEALIRARAAGLLPINLVAVFSDRAKAGALEIARAAGITAQFVNPRDFDSREAFDQAMFAAVDGHAPDLIVLAGFMRILSPSVVALRAGRMINIHPSLLPKYPGLHTHQRALDAGDVEHGASVHYVIPDLDAGPILAQTRIPIVPGDSPESLAARLLPKEHALLVSVVADLAAQAART
ncbi:phosphoribosylglycinamide formyltransferase [Ahniella affigens]|uniref:Phosphoribosylglycinamide formyltransferase n=1 Tax=Ahniella affigens TaxID=2021234 RepID=A0A2P1PXR4_9GAMM|nr:phosphoribosylglycinamide formyltransferase [Ahniella affigens]AVP99641.1 phosphoribosylglycinamide formyltransferase [Ahniella affigens]